MSQKSFLRSKCDFCGETQDFEGQGQLTTDQAAALCNWFTICREFMVRGQLVRVIKHACKQSCASNILSTGMMELPEDVKAELDSQPALGPMAIPKRPEGVN